jgi:hypothetical protein
VLELTGCPNITYRSLIRLAEGCRNLDSLSISSPVLLDGDEIVISLGKNCHTLRNLCLNNVCDVTDAGIIVLAEGCPDLRDLQEFSAENNFSKRITDLV